MCKIQLTEKKWRTIIQATMLALLERMPPDKETWDALVEETLEKLKNSGLIEIL